MPRRLPRQRTPTPEPPSPTIARPAHLPSDTWPTSHPEYSPEIHKLSCSINFLALRNKCSQLRHGARCIVSPKYYVGENNLVREIVFQDEVVWIALFARLDSVGEFAAQARLLGALRGRLPVPEVFSYSDNDTELGGRYVLMEGICGLRAEAEYFIFGIPDRYWNHVLQQLGEIMAEGMGRTWSTFKVDEKEYRSDTAFWIDEARLNIRGSLTNINNSRPLITDGHYSSFFHQSSGALEALFAELLYLCNEFLKPGNRPSNNLMEFPSALPSMKVKNIIFDSEYNVIGLIGFPRTESVSSWDYFQYPYGLEETFDDPSMARTVTWMREYFVGAWVQRLASAGMDWRGLQQREQWCQKEKVKVLYEFRKTKNFGRDLLQRLLSSGYYFNTTDSALLYDAFVAALLTVLDKQPTSWDAKPDYFTDLFVRLISLNPVQLQGLAEQGRLLKDGNIHPQLNDKVMNIFQMVR